MGLASSADNIRYYGTGRAYEGAVGGASFNDMGELENLNFSLAVSTEKLKSTRNAARGTLIEKITESEAKITFGLREMTNENLMIALLSSAVAADNQAAGFLDQMVPVFVSDKYVDLGKLNISSVKLTGAITGALVVGDGVTGETSAATGTIAYKAAGYIEVVKVSGTFVVGEEVYKTANTNYITTTGVEVQEDAVVTDVTRATRRVQGTDYTLDPDYGYIRKLSTGGIQATDVVSADYEAVTKNVMHGMSSASVERKLIFVSDKDDNGIRQRWTFHKVNILLNGDFPLIGDGAAVLAITGTVLKDTAQASGQEYYKVETI
jgi:hypothetical protein